MIVKNKNKIKKNFTYSLLYFLFVFLIWNIFAGEHLYSEGYVWDDIHFIRSYSLIEIMNSWKDNWIPGKFETQSYRPFAILFYHFCGSVFQENTLLLRIFIMLLICILISLVIFFFLLLGAKKRQIIILLTILISSKIFMTLGSWFTLSNLISSYIFFFLTLINFIYFKITNKFIYLIFSSFACFVSVFSREELYSLFFIVPILSYYLDKDLKKSFLSSLPIIILITAHYILRGIFVEEATNISLNISDLNIVGLIKSLVASVLPMSFYKPYVDDPVNTFSLIVWIFFLLYLLINLIKNYKILVTKINLYLLVFLIAVMSCLPSLINTRAFGIFIPSVFFFFLISCLISNSFLLTNSRINKIFIVIMILIGGAGGISRSYNHMESMSQYSSQIISADSMLIYKKSSLGYNVPTPEDRKKRKIIFLKELGINGYVTVEDLQKRQEYNKNKKIIFPIYSPLSF